MFTRTKLSEEDLELIEAAKETYDRLHVEDVHEVATALRMRAQRKTRTDSVKRYLSHISREIVYNTGETFNRQKKNIA